MRPRQLIQVSAYYPPHLGGQENAVCDLAGQLAAAGHQVQVVTSTLGGGVVGSCLEAGVRVSRLPAFVFGHAPIMPWLPYALLWLSRTNSLVHLHIGQAFTPEMVWLVSKLRGLRYVAELHIDFEPSGPVGVLLPLYKRLILGPVLRSASAVVVLNEPMLRAVREVYGYTGPAQIISNGIDEAYFALKRPPLAHQLPQTLRLLFVGRLSKQKNLAALIEALAITKQNVRLDVVGDGEERASLECLIAHYGLTNVTLHGRLERTEVMKFYVTCDALIMPSLYEAQPLVLLEAMAARLPIIGTNVVGVAEHIAGAGIVVEPTPAGLAEGFGQYGRRYAELPAMVERGYARAQQRCWPRLLKDYEALYDAAARD
ncbi:MAG TPA: glycosyltransferase family 4 protein [Candidatus Saccharimonadia bacterium]|nr:glycosyltransferase family 4 protein [Candidatus Saccharimonadia bacterium]